MITRSASAALRSLALPVAVILLVPVLVGAWQPQALGGVLAGALALAGCLALAVQASGSAWDSARAYVERGYAGGTGGTAHATALLVDSLGLRLRSACGPAMSLVLQLLVTLAVLLALGHGPPRAAFASGPLHSGPGSVAAAGAQTGPPAPAPDARN
jgi:K(+)-stimulated pyrophosphate-energized sodium pump